MNTIPPLRECDKWYQSSLRGLRQGLFYGFKIRFTHSLVMAILFRNGSLVNKLKSIIKPTLEHSVKLGVFVFLYKTMVSLFEYLFKRKSPYNSMIAGFICSFVFTEETSVNK